MAERALDLAAASRVARRVNLTDVYVSRIAAERHSTPKNDLVPELSDQYELKHLDDTIEVLCHHSLRAASEDVCVAEIEIDLHLVYEVLGEEPVNENDLTAFASANGAYHSWPFVREIYSSLTVRLGLPAFVLPTLLVMTHSAKKPPTEASEATSSGGQK